MIKSLLALTLPLALFASNILSYNVYDRTDRADIMITFDTPYEGAIKQSIVDSRTIIKLEGAQIESPKIKEVNSKYLASMSITPFADYTQIIATTAPGIVLKASKTADGYGLRLRFTDDVAPQAQNLQSQKSTLTGLPTKSGDDMTQSYVIVIVLLIAGIITLLVLKRKIAMRNEESLSQGSWLFASTKKTPQKREAKSIAKEEVTIRFQSRVNEHSSVVMLDFAQSSYLVLMGPNNILLDKFHGDQPTSQEDFERLLQENYQDLDQMLKVEAKPSFERESGFDAYKSRASSSLFA
ncbi:MAG: hypothetical protein IE916_02515 [Epsilonproteobacteria bacterium]|nr:hypothetical protein [Campylobacterota bacterium]